jgi:hypothetical protein
MQYEQKFNAHMTNIIMEKIIFIAGTYLTLLVIMTFYDERLLIYIRLFDRNLLWYVAILTSCISLARMMMVYPSTIDETAEEIMSKISKYTHYHPNANANPTKKLSNFKKLYSYKIFAVLIELISVFVMPWYILFRLSRDIETIAKFVERNTIYHEKMGYICKYGLIEKHDDIDIAHDDIDDHDFLVRKADNLNEEKVSRSVKNFHMYYSSVHQVNEDTILGMV